MSWTYFAGLVVVLVGMIIPIFVLQSPTGRCYGNQLNFGDVRLHRVERPLLFASAFDNGSDNREATFKRLNGTVYKFGERPSNNLRHYAVETRIF